MVNIRVVGDMGCERIHKEKKRREQRFYFYFPKGGKGLGVKKGAWVRALTCYWEMRWL